MTNDPIQLTNSTSYTGQGKVVVGNGSYAPISHIGESYIFFDSQRFSINDLLYVSDIHKSIFSVSKFSKDNQVFLEFHPSCCYVKDLATHRVLLQGIESNGLYQLLPTPSNEFAFTAFNNSAPSSPVPTDLVVSENTTKLTTWHQRLGHPSTHVLSSVLCAYNINLSRSTISSLFNTCALGKSHKLPFKSATSVYFVPLKLIITDHWGPAPCFSAGYQYYISFVDTFSRHTWIYFLKSKFDALQAFLTFKQHVELQLGTKIKQLQSDGVENFGGLISL